MKKSIVCEKLRKGEPIMVAKHNFFNAELAEMIGYCGYDALWICNEHEMIDRSLLASILRGAKITGIASSAIGRENMNSVPTPSVEMTLMCSSWALIISLVMERPSPVPFLSLPRERSVL